MPIQPTLPIIPIIHTQQRTDGDCLAACAAMVLSYYGNRMIYETIVRLLKTSDYGTPFTNLQRLEQLRMTVVIQRQTHLAELEHLLQQSIPIIVSVDTGELPYWERHTAHAVVVVGIDDEFIFLHDPDLPRGPIAVKRGDFELAWLNRDEEYAVIR